MNYKQLTQPTLQGEWNVILADKAVFDATPTLNRHIFSAWLDIKTTTLHLLSEGKLIQILPSSSFRRIKPSKPWKLVWQLVGVIGGAWISFFVFLWYFAATSIYLFAFITLPVVFIGCVFVACLVFYYYNRDWWLEIQVEATTAPAQVMYLALTKSLFKGRGEDKQLLLLQQHLQRAFG